MPTALLVAHHYPPHVGGLELVVERQARSLVENGYRVIVLTSRLEAPQPAEEPRPGVEVIRVACWHVFERRFFIPFPLFSPGLIPRAWRALRRVDIVHIHDVFYLSSWVVAALAAIARKPVLLTQHVAMVEHRSRLVMSAQRLVYATAGKWIFARARSIFVYNENVRAFLRARRVTDDRIRLLANGIDTAQFRPAGESERREIRGRYGLPQDRPLVLFVGRLVEKKGYQLLLDARDARFDLVFVGPGNVPTSGRAPGVHWLGSLGQAQTAELFRACDVFAFPAVGEVFTLVMQEAMASGLPVVTTDDPAYAGSIVAGHVILCRRLAECFKEAIQSLLADSDRLRDLNAHGRELAVRHFDWHANFKPLMTVYSDVLREGAA
ncbi:MAG TPA: glycosyltransferase family 4 protein [Steroidobacteraceae bacterium]|jgi:glycosyltransferase involved in cell wall biosynthesis|nr:glycosyltransferase family 4 protein [Steroidobacteraceae bacterium]